MVTSETEYAEMVRSFELAGFSKLTTEFLYADNTKSNSFDAYEAYRKFSRIAKGKFIIYCHQDVLAIDSINVLDEKINELEEMDPHWAIAGNAGASTFRKYFKYFVNNNNEHENIGDIPVQVTSLDENFLVIKRKAGLSTSADLHGFHFYGTDLCLNADILGYNCYVIKYLVKHKSWGNQDEAFRTSQKKFINKYSWAMRTRVIQTTCVRIVVSGQRTISKIGNMKVTLFLIKEYKKRKDKFTLKW